MSLLSEISKTVVDATLAFTSVSSSTTASGTGDSLASGEIAQPYKQVGDPIPIPNSTQGNYCLGSFDGNTTTFAYPIILPSGAAEVHIYANGAVAVDAPPDFSLATTLPVVGSSGTTYFAMTQLSSNGLVCVYGSGSDVGGAAVFTRPSTSSQTWTQVATVHGAPGDNLGDAVNISADGTVITMGSYTSNGGVGSTNVYSFNAATGTLTLVTTLVGTGAVGGSQQGYFNALSGDGTTLVVGGPQDNARYGAVWTFKNAGDGTWTQMGTKLAPYNASPGAFFGEFVALSYDGTRLAVAATLNSLAQPTGSVFMYNLVDGAWVQGQTIYPPLPTASPSIAMVALSDDGTTLMLDQQNYNSNKGAAFVYNLQANGLWVQNGEARVPTGALFQNPASLFYLVGASRTGSMFAVAGITSTAPGDPVAFAVFQ